MHIGVIGNGGSQENKDDFYEDERERQRAAESKPLLEQGDAHLRRHDTKSHEPSAQDDPCQGKLEDLPEQR
jgi:hypothetical protein